MGQAWQKKGKRVSRGTKSEMSTTKGQSRERGRVNPGTSGMKEGVSKPCHEGCHYVPQFIKQQSFNTSMTVLNLF